jgi:AraC-like DNA-binding protein
MADAARAPDMPATRTLDMPATQRFDFWKSVLAETFVPLEVTRPGGSPDFRGQLYGRDLGTLRICQVQAEPHTALRTPRLVKAAPSGCYKLGLLRRGSAVLAQNGREAALRPGDFVLYDTDRPYTLGFAHEHRMLILLFPRDLLGLPSQHVARLTATTMPGQRGGLGGLIGPFLTQVADVASQVDGRVALRLSGNVLDLLTTVLAERLDCPANDADSAHRALMLRITAFIEENLASPDLSPQLIAAANHISLRQLHKLFHATGTTVGGWIRQRRLERCGRDLRDPALVDRPVAAIGARWGYPDPAHFSRLFKSAYGMGPRDYRYHTDAGHVIG